MKADQELKLAIFKQLAENKEEGFLLMDARTQQIVEHNATLLELWEQENKTYSHLQDLVASVHPDDQSHFVVQLDQFAPGDFLHVEFRLNRRPDAKWIKCKMYKLQEDQQNLIACFMYDITNEKANKQYLLDVNERKNTALHILGHDLRNPIAAIMAANSLLERSYKNQRFEDIATFVDIIRQYCEKTNNLIKSVLEYEYYQSDSVEINRTRFELSSRINLIFDTYRIGHQQPKEFLLQANYPVYIEADEVKLMLVFENLISNAYKFTGDNGIVTVSLEEQEDALVAKVFDNGIGIPAENLPIIFDQFTKARREGTHGEQPIGLGLHITKKLVEMHQGSISVDSISGQGTTFTIRIPYL